jgi:hypothetical protein
MTPGHELIDIPGCQPVKFSEVSVQYNAEYNGIAW